MTTNGSTQIIRRVEGPGVPIRGDDIDTDQIVPARFLKEITFENMGKYAFYDLRHDAQGAPNDHPFNRFTGARILIVNQNFGCGSSREHAPQALLRWGIRGIVGESFAEIFAGNCQALGIPTVRAPREVVAPVMEQVERAPETPLAIDVEAATLTVGEETHAVALDDAQQQALLQGLWDTTALMRSYMDAVRETSARLPYLRGFAP